MTVAAAVAHLAGWGLPGGAAKPMLLTGLRGIARAVAAERVTGPALAALADGAAIEVPDGIVGELEAHHLDHIHQSLMAEADMVAIGEVLASAGVDFRVLKGCAAAHLDYPDPALRTTSDVDLLVQTGQYSAALAALGPHVDWSASPPEFRPGWTARYGKAHTLRIGNGWLDLHQRLWPGYWGFAFDPAPLFTRPGESFTVAGETFQGLARGDRMMMALTHAAMPNTTLQSMRDAAVLSRDTPIADVIGDPAYRSVAPLAWAGARRIVDRLGLDGLETGPQPSAGLRERAALWSVDVGRGHWSGPLGLPPWRWVGYAGPILFPATEHRAYYGRSHADRWRRAVRTVRGGLSRPRPVRSR